MHVVIAMLVRDHISETEGEYYLEVEMQDIIPSVFKFKYLGSIL